MLLAGALVPTPRGTRPSTAILESAADPRIAELLAEADTCEGPCRAACALWARLVRSARPGQVGLAPEEVGP